MRWLIIALIIIAEVAFYLTQLAGHTETIKDENHVTISWD